MPRDDLTIDLVKAMAPTENMDPAVILDEWINRAQNLPEEIRFLQEEIAEKDRLYDKLLKEIEDRDGRIQKFIKANGSHADNPREAEYRAAIIGNYDMAEKLAAEKVALSQKMQVTMDKHLRYLDMQMKLLYDRNEPGFNDADEVPSLVRPSAANVATVPALRPSGPTTTSVLVPVTNNTSQVLHRGPHSQLKTDVTLQQHALSAPASPAASILLSRQAREGSAGPGGGASKKGPRSGIALVNAPVTSSGLARHSSLGPGTPKPLQQTATGVQRAGSAGPRAPTKITGPGRKSSAPASGAGRKRSMPGVGAGGNKSGLSRVKRVAKNSQSSAVDSELSDAETGSGNESDVRTGGRGTSAARSSSQAQNHHREGSHEPGLQAGSHGRKEGPPSGAMRGPRGARANDEDSDDDAMDLDDEEAGDDRKYCLCNNVSFGDMVACDNPECPYEWFHWGCVGLKSEPNGAWFCPVCASEGS